MTILTAAMIDHLIGARNRITDTTAEFIDTRAVDHIDAVLSEVPQGHRPDVDALLGRKRIVMVQHADGAQEVNPAWFVAQAVTLPDAQAVADAKMADYIDWQHGERGAGCAGNSADEYDSASEGHW